MRQCIFVVGTRDQVPELAPLLTQARSSGLKYSVWVTAEQAVDEALATAGVKTGIVMPQRPAPRSRVARLLYWAPLTAYRCYNYVHGVRMWTAKSPLILVHGNSLSTWLVSRAGRWGGGQLVHLQHTANSAPAQHRIMKKARFAFCGTADVSALAGRYRGCTVVGVEVNDPASVQVVTDSLLRWTGGKSSASG